MKSFSKIDKKRISDTVFEQLRQNIISENLSSGTRLPSEQDLARQFGVSRTSIRAAIQRLGTLGLLETRNGEGTFIREPSVGSIIDPVFKSFHYKPEQILEILEFRMAVEMLSCRLAARRANSSEISHLGQIIDRMLLALEADDHHQYSIEDLQFHRFIAEISHNSLLLTVIENLSDFYLGHLIAMNRQINLTFGIEYHVSIFQAISRHDEEMAEQMIGESISRSMAEVKTWQESR